MHSAGQTTEHAPHPVQFDGGNTVPVSFIFQEPFLKNSPNSDDVFPTTPESV